MKQLKQKLVGIVTTLLLLVGSITPIISAKAVATDTNLITNSSVETSTAGVPDSWQNSSWGTNNASFQYLNTGHTGTQSVQVSISTYNDGDAKWFFNPVAISPGTIYTFSDFYQSNTTTEVVAEVTLTDGTIQYLDLGPVTASSAWTQVSLNLTTPSNAAQITIFHLLQSVGSLTVDDLSLTTYTAPPPPPPVTVTNGVPNSSVETVSSDPTFPAGWQTGSWGTNNAKFQYLTSGHTGTRSINVSINSYTSGDAKWIYDTQPIKPNSSYIFSDYYQSSVKTYGVAEITSNSGVISYLDLGSVAASSSWGKASFYFYTPSDASRITVFHLLESTGSLTTDDFSLTETQVVTNGVPNNSLEIANQNAPVAWQTGSWGTNNARFQYLNSGHSGTRSVKVSIRSYTDGDAKWYFDPQSIQPNSTYYFDDYYQSNTTTPVILMYTLTDGSVQYILIGYASASSTWQHTHLPFTTPANAAKLTVLHLLNHTGYLTTDDYAITPYVISPLSQGMVSFTFDDGYADLYQNALPLLNKYGVKSTQFIVSSFIQNSVPDYMTPAMIKGFYASGHEIGSHTVTHPDLTLLTRSQIDNELSQSKTYLTNLLGEVPTDIASPYGTYNSLVLQEIRKYYQSHRSVDVNYVDLAAYDPYDIRVQNVDASVTPQQVESWIAYANQNKVWLVLVFHSIDSQTSYYGQYNWTPTNLEVVLGYIQQTTTKTATIHQGVVTMQSSLH